MLNVKQKYLEELLGIFSGYCPNAEIFAYGSRIKNSSHSGSDLDLVVKCFHDEGKRLSELKELINDSGIPFLVDICEFDRLPKSFQQEVMKEYVRIFPAEGDWV